MKSVTVAFAASVPKRSLPLRKVFSAVRNHLKGAAFAEIRIQTSQTSKQSDRDRFGENHVGSEIAASAFDLASI